MIHIEYEEFTIAVPIERRMTVEQFLSVADRLERIAGRSHAPAPTFEAHAPTPAAWQPQPAHHAHTAFDDHESQHVFGHVPRSEAAHPAHGEEFRFEQEDTQRLEYFMDRLARQLAKLEETHVRLERMERTLIDHGIQPRH